MESVCVHTPSEQPEGSSVVGARECCDEPSGLLALYHCWREGRGQKGGEVRGGRGGRGEEEEGEGGGRRGGRRGSGRGVGEKGERGKSWKRKEEEERVKGER